MKSPKTIKGFISLMQHITTVKPHMLKGYMQLSKAQQSLIGVLIADTENNLADFVREEEILKKKKINNKILAKNLKKVGKKFAKINKYIEAGKKIPKSLSKNFVTFPLVKNPYKDLE